ncbi:Holliday junction branch migration protein RuvA [Leuconostoc fallax]|mgnify:CR=1 FL=1|uniref:Holliday junction branch migration complex subunit RuvA n=1 Tax=Leuconostoc fallax TaxID=1251 RepID=A0A4R5NB38_9LACO|nr:Holliday junction branch migration protein RuvA [Leuconostoc fallax]MBU7456241.1 Holliday junction branch migration protein RuvA [Leuconostoc fallax]MCO6184445.1 Holliday junction branch migration protein RuvA [Leuconostoc fallax]TDG69066.1 hypothetical protein C5L23_001197 [Leuconostoc fallax]
MYEYINGLITLVEPAYLVVENNGIGYRLNIANPYRFTEKTSRIFYIEQIVRETEISLYGFADASEKKLFNKLLDVSGIGPKSALAILASDSAIGLASAVENDDVSYLTQFPGVGKKTAQQIILDLKGKLDDLVSAADAPEQSIVSKQDHRALDDALDALIALGYTSRDVKMIGKKLDGVVDTTDGYIRQALKLLVK